MKAKFFRTAADFRRWLQQNHPRAAQLVVGFRPVGSGGPSLRQRAGRTAPGSTRMSGGPTACRPHTP